MSSVVTDTIEGKVISVEGDDYLIQLLTGGKCGCMLMQTLNGWDPIRQVIVLKPK
jgi:hypothetical protein